MAKTTRQSPAAEPQGEKGPEKLTNKTEAVRRALNDLGRKAMPVAIQEHVKKRYGVDISTKVISVYKGKLAKEGRRRHKPGPKPNGETATTKATPRVRSQADVAIRDLRAIKELSNRIGPARLRDLLEVLG